VATRTSRSPASAAAARRKARVAALLAAALLAAGALTFAPGCALRRHDPAGAAPAGSATVVSDVDGDTITVRLAGHEERVRLLGIDTPETKDPRKPVQCFGHEASQHTAALLPPGTKVRLVRDVEARDRYGRLLAYVYRASDGLFVNLDLAEQGFASLLTYPPNVAHEPELAAAVAHARAADLGLWARCGGPGVPLSTDR
jgi:micrococcal nuclease